MSSEKEKAFARLEILLRPKLEELRRLVRTKYEIVKEISEIVDKSGMVPPEWISSFLKWLFEKEEIEISDRTIENACGPLYKKKRTAKNVEIADKKEIEVSSSGSESYTKADGTEGEREREGEPTPLEVSEQATEIALTLAEQYAADIKARDLRLNEALHLADDKNKRIEQLLLENGELELKIIDLKTAADQAKEIDSKEDLQIENDNMKQTIQELQEALRAKVKASGFTQASQLPKQVWLAAINAINFYRELNKASRFAIEHNDPWKRIVFEVAEDGQLKAAKLEAQAEER